MADSHAAAKRAAGRAAADLVVSGSSIGLGTGSTVAHVLERLAERIAAEDLQVRGVATSVETAARATALGIPLTDLDAVEVLDLTIDGADEVDPRKNLVKGGGGALLREKIVAAASRELVVVVSRNKLVDRLGAFRVPVEIVGFGRRQTIAALERLGARVSLRQRGAQPILTDNGNPIVDCDFGLIDDPGQLERRIAPIPGVIETGLFVGMTGRIVVGDPDGGIELLS